LGAPHLQLLQTPREVGIIVAQEVLAETGLVHLQDRSIQSLSGRERQPVSVTRALAQRPRLLLLDEPTAHLDLGNKELVLNIIRRQTAQGVTTVFATHEILTAPNLTQTFGVPVDVVEIAGRRPVLS
jgi:iron complex transport system ATP-binding protein